EVPSLPILREARHRRVVRRVLRDHRVEPIADGRSACRGGGGTVHRTVQRQPRAVQANHVPLFRGFCADNPTSTWRSPLLWRGSLSARTPSMASPAVIDRPHSSMIMSNTKKPVSDAGE